MNEKYRRTCASPDPMREGDWMGALLVEKCYFQPQRDCPGWKAGGTCGRIEAPIPADALKGDYGD